jgi:hypothetical protein
MTVTAHRPERRAFVGHQVSQQTEQLDRRLQAHEYNPVSSRQSISHLTQLWKVIVRARQHRAAEWIQTLTAVYH